METSDINLENKNYRLPEYLGQSFDENEYKEQLSELEEKKELMKIEQNDQMEDKLGKLFENDNKKVDTIDESKREKVQEFVKNNCSEPIEGINTIVPFRMLVKVLVKGAESEGKLDVKESILEGNAKDKGIYELEAYKKLLDKGFVLPSDNRSYKNEQYHLGVDYNVVEGTKVKSMYKGKVVASGLDGGLGHRVIIEHEMEDGTKFYSLYAHLASEGLPSVGADVEQGMIIGEVGKAFTEENGDWEEHLHFQIMENADSPKGYSEDEGIGNYDVLKSFGENKIIYQEGVHSQGM